MAGVFNRQMIEQAVEAEYGHTFLHWRHEFEQFLRDEAEKIWTEDPEWWS